MSSPTTHRGMAAPFGALLVAVLSFSLLQTMPVPALPDLQREFSSSTTTVSWVLSAFLLSASVSTGLLGRIGDMFGKRRVLLGCLTVSAAGTMLAALAGSVGVLIAARAIQGVGAATFPLAFGIVRDEFPRERVPVAIGWISSTFGIGFGFGLVIPGLLVDRLSWEWIFWVMFAVTVVGLAAVAAFVPESPVRSPSQIDWVGAVLLSGGLVTFLLAISEGRVWGWTSTAILGLLVVAVVLLTMFGLVEARLEAPLIDIRLLGKRAVLTPNITALIIGFGMYGAFTLVPKLVQTPSRYGYGFDASVTQAGLFIIPMAVAMLFASPLAGRIGARIGFKFPLALACLINAVGFLVFGFAHDTRLAIYLGNAITGVGVGFAFASLANLVVNAVDQHQTGEATGINTIMRTIGGTFGAQIASTAVTSKRIAGTSIPAESGYTSAFILSAMALAVATLAALTVPGHLRRSTEVTTAAPPARTWVDG